jgi:hypothetical protein
MIKKRTKKRKRKKEKKKQEEENVGSAPFSVPFDAGTCPLFFLQILFC